MRRAIVLGVLVAVGGLSVAVAALQQPQQAPQVVEVEKLKDNLFMLKNGGGNTAVFIASNGVVVVDTKNPGWGQKILDKIKELTPKPVTTIINTHTHADHVSGNVEFPATVDVVTQENTRTNMEKMAPTTGSKAGPPPQTIFQQNGGRGLPKHTFKDRMTLFSGADRVELYYFGPGHTNGDAWIVFPALRFMHAGDIFSGKNIPLIDANNGGSAMAFPDSLGKAYTATQKEVDSIITGHSTVMTPNDLKEYADFNRDFLNFVREGKKAGKTVDEIAASFKIPPKYAGYADPNADRLKANVQIAYNEIK